MVGKLYDCASRDGKFTTALVWKLAMFNAGPTSKTEGQHQNNIGSMPRVW